MILCSPKNIKCLSVFNTIHSTVLISDKTKQLRWDTEAHMDYGWMQQMALSSDGTFKYIWPHHPWHTNTHNSQRGCFLPFSWVAYRLHLFVACPFTTTAQRNWMQAHPGTYMRSPLIQSFLEQTTKFLNINQHLLPVFGGHCIASPFCITNAKKKRKRMEKRESLVGNTEGLSASHTLLVCVCLWAYTCVLGAGGLSGFEGLVLKRGICCFSLHPAMTWTPAIDSKPDLDIVSYQGNKEIAIFYY